METPLKTGSLNRPSFLLFAVLWGAGGYVFYITYVPLVASFQFIFIPLLVLVFLVSAHHIRSGTLLFVFFLPLINNLPYFFGLFEPLPVAPTALVLFLAYFLGWLIYQAKSDVKLRLPKPLLEPLLLFSGVVVISALITFFRFANFFPLLSDRIYDLKTNVMGVSAGGAIMSLTFNSLNYLTGVLFLFAFLNIEKSERFMRSVVRVVCAGSLIALIFGLFQRIHDKLIGNNPISIAAGLINATFKDAHAFGAYLAVVVPFLVGAMFAYRRLWRWLSLLVIGLSLYLILFSGSRSAFLSMVISLATFAALSFPVFVDFMKSRKSCARNSRRPVWRAVCLAIVAGIGIVIVSGHFKKDVEKSITYLRLKGQDSSLASAARYRAETLWKMALAMIRDYPLTGVGMGGYIIEVSNYAHVNGIQLVPESAENYILQVGSELGLIGLFLFLWIGWEILRQMRRSYSRLPGHDPSKFILSGVIAALFAFFLNVQMHSHIGSFEVQYVFWLLVGFVFSLGRRDEEKEEKVALGRRSLTLGCLLLVAFGAIHLRNSTHSLSLKSRTELFAIKQDFGFFQLERTNDGREFRWTRSCAGLALKIEKPILRIPLLASHPDIGRDPVKVKISIVRDFFKQTKPLGEIILSRSAWQTYEYRLPDELNRDVILLFKVSRTWNPRKQLGVSDPRDLGVAVGTVDLLEELEP